MATIVYFTEFDVRHDYCPVNLAGWYLLEIGTGYSGPYRNTHEAQRVGEDKGLVIKFIGG